MAVDQVPVLNRASYCGVSADKVHWKQLAGAGQYRVVGHDLAVDLDRGRLATLRYCNRAR
jgi:hypothetical protein